MIFSLTSTSEITIIDQLACVNRVTHRRSQEPDVCCIYFDILATKTIEQFVQLMARNVLGRLDPFLHVAKREGFVLLSIMHVLIIYPAPCTRIAVQPFVYGHLRRV